MFSNELYLETSIKIFDLFLHNGWKFIFKVSLALLSQIENMQMEEEELFMKLKGLTKNLSLDDVIHIIRASCFPEHRNTRLRILY